ncbi:MAG: NADH-quinone oxidoreductase subunit D [Candidatus Syntrophoarchaeum sp.]|nr:NADH-quinone oxidoreductase subunit D [Candidatus Syntrophoarchaeum sp.]
MMKEEETRNINIVNSEPLSPLKKWSAKWSLWPCHFVTSCCGVELAHAYGCGYDGERLGSLAMGISRQANTIIVEGTITRKMARPLRVVWEQMPDPKFVNVIGACGERGGIFWNSYHITHPHRIVPVDFFVPGCPVTPEALLRGIRALQDKIEGDDRSTISFRTVDLSGAGGKKNRVPESPKIIAPTPLVKPDIPSGVRWEEGEQIVEMLKKVLGELVISITVTDKDRIAIKTTPENIREVAARLSAEMKIDHVKSVNVIDVPHERKFIIEYTAGSYEKELMPVLFTIFADLRSGKDEISFPSLADIWMSADYTERELQDFFGVKFEGNPGREGNFLLAPDTPKFPLRRSFKLEEERYVLEDDKPFAPVIDPPTEFDIPLPPGLEEEVGAAGEYLLLVGPHHTGSGHLRWIMRLKGDTLSEVIPDPGYVHRSMEKLAENRLYIQNIPLFERLCIVDPFNVNLGYVRTIEKALKIDVPERATYIRTLMAELSRIDAFTYDAGIFSLFMGHSTGFMYLWAIREMLLEMITAMTGSRCSPSFIIPGGIRRDISDEVLNLVEKLPTAVQGRLRKFEDIFVNNPVLISRVKGVGVLSREDAIKAGIVGPFLRASGVEYDIRKIEPYEAYGDLDWEVIGADDGDCLVRFLVRLEEMQESLNIVKQCVEKLKSMERGGVMSEAILGEYSEAKDDIRGSFYRVFGNLVLPRGEWSTVTEAARGTLFFSILSDGDSNVPYRVRTISPSWYNLRGIIEASRGEKMADFWAVYGSFGYFPPEADR